MMRRPKFVDAVSAAWLRRSASKREAIAASTLEELSLAGIDRVTFFKRDELTTDLICCAVEVDGRIWFFHEEMEGWDALLRHLERLPGFRADWYAHVFRPAFATCETIAYSRDGQSE